MDKQKNHMLQDRARTRMAKTLEPGEKLRLYALNADYRLAENPETARLLARERHGMLTAAETAQLKELRATMIDIAIMCDSITF